PGCREAAVAAFLLVGVRGARETRLAGERVAAAGQCVGGADGAQLAHQRGQVVVAVHEGVAVEHRVAEAGVHQRVSELRDRGERADVRHADVGRGEGGSSLYTGYGA